MPGGFHPFHAGHAALYQSAIKAFPNADVYVAATNDTSTRPFPFNIKEKLARVAGVTPGHFVQVTSPFRAEEITRHYDPNSDVLIFIRSEKDRNEQPKPGGRKKDGTLGYLQPYNPEHLEPFAKHAYIAYLPTVEFGPGITSATEIRNIWPNLTDKRKLAMVLSLYPTTQKNPRLAKNIVQLLSAGIGNNDEKTLKEFVPDHNDRDDGDDDDGNAEEAMLRKYAAKWWNGDEQTQLKVENTLASIGWEIGEDESGDEDAACFLVRVGDEHGGSYISFGVSDLESMNEDLSESSEDSDDVVSVLNSHGYYPVRFHDNTTIYVNKKTNDKFVRLGANWKHQSGIHGHGPAELQNFFNQ